MKKNRRLIAIGGLLAGIFFLVGILGSTQLPKIRSWILVRIEKESREHLPVRILPTSLEVNLFPLGASLTGVRIFPKEEIASLVDAFVIDRLDVSVSTWQLLQGHLRLNAIDVGGTSIVVRVPPSKKKSGKPLEGLFQILDQIPIAKLNLEDINVRLDLADPKLRVGLENATLSLEKKKGLVDLDVESVAVRVFDPESKANVLLDFEADGRITPNKILVEALRIRRGDSFFVASGTAEGDTEALQFGEADGQMRGELKLDSMRDWAARTFPKLSKLPALRGRAYVEAKGSRKGGGNADAQFQVRADGFGVAKQDLGRVSAAGSLKGDVVTIPSAEIENAAGKATLSAIQLKAGSEDVTFEGTLKTERLSLHELLIQLGVGKIPLFMHANGELPCSGSLKPEFKLTCKGHIQGNDLVLRDAMDPKALVITSLKTFSAEGEVTADEHKVTYTTELSMPDSKGRSSGTIEYETGFKIDFEADRLSMKDVTSLANLKIEGAARVKGSTSGNAHVGTVSLFLDGNDMWFEDYWLGNPKGNIAYKAANLYFTDLQGYYTVSRYGGDLTLDLHDKKVAVVGRIPFFDARDLLKIFSRRVKLPFPVTGTGQATIKVSGPLDFPHLSYDLKSSIFRGAVAGETFDQAHFDVKSVGGEVKAERVQVNKGAAVVTLNGVAHPSGQIETILKGRGIHLEDTTTIASSGFALSGQVDFDMAMSGHVLAPDTDMKGTLTKTSIGDQSVADSNFRLRFGKKAIEGSGVFMGDVVQADLVFPFDDEAPFKLKLKTQDWNFAPLFAAIAGPNSRKDYQGRLSAEVDLSALTGGFWNATGEAKISNFSLSRGALALKSTAPIEVAMKNGQIRTKDLKLSGDGIFLEATDSPTPVAKLDTQFKGKLDLGLIALLTPFFEDLRGLVSFSVNLRGGDRPGEVLGSAYLEKGYLKFFDFPHPFEDIRADLLFNQKKILFNTIKAEFGAGQISGTGGMEFKGRHDIPVNVSGTFEKISLNVPDKMRTTGSGNFTFTGNWFPFLLKGNYLISEGLMTKEFGGEQGSGDNIRRDFYLPDFLVEQDFVPLLLDLNVDFTKGVAVKNELVEGRAMGQISVKGQPTKPVLVGSITTDKETKINFRETIFEVTNSNVTFDGGDTIDPKLFLTATSRVGTYDINLLLQGTGTAPNIQLTSVPPLPEKDIISLLAFGATDQDLNSKISSNAQASQTGIAFGTGVIRNNAITSTIKQATGFDVQFSAGFDDANNSTTKIVATRRFGQKMSLTGSRSLGKSPETEGKVQYRLTDKFSVIGSALSKEYPEAADAISNAQKTPTKVGVDFEYRFQFK